MFGMIPNWKSQCINDTVHYFSCPPPSFLLFFTSSQTSTKTQYMDMIQLMYTSNVSVIMIHTLIDSKVNHKEQLFGNSCSDTAAGYQLQHPNTSGPLRTMEREDWHWHSAKMATTAGRRQKVYSHSAMLSTNRQWQLLHSLLHSLTEAVRTVFYRHGLDIEMVSNQSGLHKNVEKDLSPLLLVQNPSGIRAQRRA